jgi:hypothetical protein
MRARGRAESCPPSPPRGAERHVQRPGPLFPARAPPRANPEWILHGAAPVAGPRGILARIQIPSMQGVPIRRTSYAHCLFEIRPAVRYLFETVFRTSTTRATTGLQSLAPIFFGRPRVFGRLAPEESSVFFTEDPSAQGRTTPLGVSLAKFFYSLRSIANTFLFGIAAFPLPFFPNTDWLLPNPSEGGVGNFYSLSQKAPPPQKSSLEPLACGIWHSLCAGGQSPQPTLKCGLGGFTGQHGQKPASIY